MTAGILGVGQPDIGFRVRVWVGISGLGSRRLGFWEVRRGLWESLSGTVSGQHFTWGGFLFMDFLISQISGFRGQACIW